MWCKLYKDILWKFSLNVRSRWEKFVLNNSSGDMADARGWRGTFGGSKQPRFVPRAPTDLRANPAKCKCEQQWYIFSELGVRIGNGAFSKYVRLGRFVRNVDSWWTSDISQLPYLRNFLFYHYHQIHFTNLKSGLFEFYCRVYIIRGSSRGSLVEDERVNRAKGDWNTAKNFSWI